MTTQLIENVLCDDGCGATIEYGTPRVHIERGRYTDPQLSAAVEFVDLDFIDFTHLQNYVKQQAVTVQALVDQAAAEAVAVVAEPPLALTDHQA